MAQSAMKMTYSEIAKKITVCSMSGSPIICAFPTQNSNYKCQYGAFGRETNRFLTILISKVEEKQDMHKSMVANYVRTKAW